MLKTLKHFIFITELILLILIPPFVMAQYDYGYSYDSYDYSYDYDYAELDYYASDIYIEYYPDPAPIYITPEPIYSVPTYIDQLPIILPVSSNYHYVPAPAPQTNILPPVVTINANPTTITYPGSSIITWNSQNASSCWGSSAWAGTMAPSGSVSVSPMQTADYTINCVNINGQQSSAGVVITVDKLQPQPIITNLNPNPQILPSVTVNLNLTPAMAVPGASVLLVWNTANASSCSASGSWSGSKSLSGSEVVNPTVNSTYTLTCYNPQGYSSYDSKTFYVNNTVVIPSQQTFTAACAPSVSSAQTGQSVLFAAADSSSSGSVTYSWSGDVSGSGHTRAVSFSAPGHKIATVTATDSTGRIAQASCSVNINSQTVAAATVSNFTRSVVNLRPAATALAAGKCELNKCLSDKDLTGTDSDYLENIGGFGKRLLAAIFTGENGDISWLNYIFAALFVIMLLIIVFLIRKLNRQRRLQVDL